MPQHVTRWMPDTCRCELDLVFDDAGTLLETRVLRACPRHTAGDDVVAENRRKNDALNRAKEAMPAEARGLVRWSLTDAGGVEIEVPVAAPDGLEERLTDLGATLRVRRAN